MNVFAVEDKANPDIYKRLKPRGGQAYNPSSD